MPKLWKSKNYLLWKSKNNPFILIEKFFSFSYQLKSTISPNLFNNPFDITIYIHSCTLGKEALKIFFISFEAPKEELIQQFCSVFQLQLSLIDLSKYPTQSLLSHDNLSANLYPVLHSLSFSLAFLDELFLTPNLSIMAPLFTQLSTDVELGTCILYLKQLIISQRLSFPSRLRVTRRFPFQ